MAGFEVKNSNFVDRVRESFVRQGFMNYLGAQIEEVVAGSVSISVPFSDQLSQQHGFFHGGLIGTIADNTGGYSAFTLMAETDSVLTVEFKINIVAPAKGELLVAKGRVIRPGRTLTVCQSDVYVEQNGTSKLCATMVGTFMTMKDTPDEPI